jgi:uncharacterized protein YgiM (DUF1202 family)
MAVKKEKKEELEPTEPVEDKVEIEDILAEGETEPEEDLDLEEAIEEEPEPVITEKETPKAKDKIVEKTKVIEKVKEVEKEPKEKEEKAPAQTPEEPPVVNNTTVVKKRSLAGTLAIIILTIIVTAAAVLGAVWWFYRSSSTKTAEPQAVETKTEEKTEANVVYVNAADGLKLRQEPSSTSQQLAVIPNGTALTVLETQGDWLKVTYQNQTGWVFGQFTTKEKPFDADWKTYTGSGFSATAPKFSIKYPGDWTLAEYKISKVDGGKTYKISLGEGGHGFTEDEAITSSSENIIYNNYPAKKTTIKSSGNIVFIGVSFTVKDPNQPTSIEFWVPEGYSPSYLDTFEKMLSTINFL